MFDQSRRSLLAGMILVVGLAGCNDGPGDLRGGRVATVPAKGRLTRADGKPVSGGKITLTPMVNGGSSNQAAAPIQPDGSFVLGSFDNGDGAVPGKYHVLVDSDGVKLNPLKEIEVEVRAGQDLDIKLP